MLLFSFTANSALSATTSKTIQGTAPYLTTPLTNEIKAESFSLLGFKFKDKEYYAADLSKLYIDPTQYSPASLTLAIKGVVKSPTGTEASDDDGDGDFTLSASSSLDVLVTIYNDSGGEIPSNTTKTFRELLCSSTPSKPYTAKIKIAGNLSLTTAYGDPRHKDYTIQTAETNKRPSKEYEVPISAICNLKPTSMKVYDTGDLSIPGGYNTTKFDKSKGFKVGSGFPTTGFKGAVFSIIGSGNDQSKYRCKSADDKGKISLSGTASPDLGENCTVTYNSETKGAFTAGGTPKITLEYYNGSIWSHIDSFTISEPSKWARVIRADTANGTAQYNTVSDFSGTYPAAELCGATGLVGIKDRAMAAGYFFSRTEITNAPNATVASGSFVYNTNERFSRNTGTFIGEWGYLYNSYPQSDFGTHYSIWTSDLSETGQFGVDTYYGVVYDIVPNEIRLTVCR